MSRPLTHRSGKYPPRPDFSSATARYYVKRLGEKWKIKNSLKVDEDYQAPEHWPVRMAACIGRGHSSTCQASSLQGRNSPHPQPDVRKYRVQNIFWEMASKCKICSQALEDYQPPEHWLVRMAACIGRGYSSTGQASSLQGRNSPHPQPDVRKYRVRNYFLGNGSKIPFKFLRISRLLRIGQSEWLPVHVKDTHTQVGQPLSRARILLIFSQM